MLPSGIVIFRGSILALHEKMDAKMDPQPIRIQLEAAQDMIAHCSNRGNDRVLDQIVTE